MAMPTVLGLVLNEADRPAVDIRVVQLRNRVLHVTARRKFHDTLVSLLLVSISISHFTS
jgi:hypothetical protein